MQTRGGGKAAAVGAAFLVGVLAACGSGGSRSGLASPTIVQPTPTPTPTPTPRQTVTVDAPGALLHFSPVMPRIVAPQAYEFTIRPLAINPPYPGEFLNTVDIWLSTGSEVLAASSIGFSIAWDGNNHWEVNSYRTGQ